LGKLSRTPQPCTSFTKFSWTSQILIAMQMHPKFHVGVTKF
jgi:hypothetical protein